MVEWKCASFCIWKIYLIVSQGFEAIRFEDKNSFENLFLTKSQLVNKCLAKKVACYNLINTFFFALQNHFQSPFFKNKKQLEIAYNLNRYMINSNSFTSNNHNIVSTYNKAHPQRFYLNFCLEIGWCFSDILRPIEMWNWYVGNTINLHCFWILVSNKKRPKTFVDKEIKY